MSRHHVDAGVFVVVIVNALSPVAGILAFQQRHQRRALHVAGNRAPGHFEKRLGVVEVLHQIFVMGTGLRDTRPLDDQRHLQRFVVHPTFVVPTVIADVETLVGRIDHDRVVGQPQLLERFHQCPDAFVDTFDAAQVVLGVTLILPANQLVGGKIRFVERLVSWCVGVPPNLQLLRASCAACFARPICQTGLPRHCHRNPVSRSTNKSKFKCMWRSISSS